MGQEPGGVYSPALRFHVVPWHALASATHAADPRLMLVMIEAPNASDDRTRMQRQCADAGLTEAESEILSLVAKGHSAKAIARLRNASAYTVRNQIAQILVKTQRHSQRELMARLGTA